MLRSHGACARQHTATRMRWNSTATATGWSSPAPSFLLALACVAVVAIAAPVASAAPGDPEQAAPPQELWNAFPLNPNSQRLGSVAGPKASFTPPGRPQTAAETPPEASRGDLPVQANAGGAAALILLALLGLAAVRLRHVPSHRRRSATPLWQGTAGIEASPVARLQHYADLDVPIARPSRLVAGDVKRRSGPRHPIRRPQAPRDPRAIAHRMRLVIWNEATAPFVVGSAFAIVGAFLIIYVIG